MRGVSSNDWNKVAKVIKSINDLRQVDCAQNMINNYKKVHGQDADHKLLELALKSKSREVVMGGDAKVCEKGSTM